MVGRRTPYFYGPLQHALGGAAQICTGDGGFGEVAGVVNRAVSCWSVVRPVTRFLVSGPSR
jgi:hypothetical protein